MISHREVEVLINICRWETGFPTSQVLDQVFPHSRKNALSSDLSPPDFTFRTNQNKFQSSTSARNCCATTTNDNRPATPCCYIQLLSVFGKPIHLKPRINTLIYGFLFWSVWEWKGKLPDSVEMLMVIGRDEWGRNKWCLLPLVGGWSRYSRKKPLFWQVCSCLIIKVYFQDWNHQQQ